MNKAMICMALLALLSFGVSPAAGYTEEEVDDGNGGTIIIAADAGWDDNKAKGKHWGNLAFNAGLHVRESGGWALQDTCHLTTGYCETKGTKEYPCGFEARARVSTAGAGVTDYETNC